MMAHKYDDHDDRRKDVSKAYDKDSEPNMFTCAHCGKKTAVGKTGTAIGGGTAAGASASA